MLLTGDPNHGRQVFKLTCDPLVLGPAFACRHVPHAGLSCIVQLPWPPQAGCPYHGQDACPSVLKLPGDLVLKLAAIYAFPAPAPHVPGRLEGWQAAPACLQMLLRLSNPPASACGVPALDHKIPANINIWSCFRAHCTQAQQAAHLIMRWRIVPS